MTNDTLVAKAVCLDRSLQCLELLGRDGWPNKLGFVRRQDARARICRCGIVITHLARFAFASSAFFFRQLLKAQIKSRDTLLTRLRRRDEFFGSLPAVLVESEFVFAVLACEHPIKGLLQSLAAFRFRPERFMIINNPVGISPGFPVYPIIDQQLFRSD